MIEFERVPDSTDRGTFPDPDGVRVEGRLAKVRVLSLGLEGVSALVTEAAKGLEIEVLLECQPYPFPDDAVIYDGALVKAMRDGGHPVQADAMEEVLARRNWHPMGSSNHSFVSMEPTEFEEVK